LTSPENYYVASLAGERLKRCYQLAPPRVRGYLEAELQYVLAAVDRSCRVLELGCGYGRALACLAERAGIAVGVDLSRESLALARRDHVPGHLVQMDALALGLSAAAFDIVICLQNGASAVGGNPARLMAEAVRVARPGGQVFVASYAERFWQDRLEWFELQAAHGLIGKIDHSLTGSGTIVCQDGFRATTVTPSEFHTLAADLGRTAQVVEVDGSSVICQIRV